MSWSATAVARVEERVTWSHTPWPRNFAVSIGAAFARTCQTKSSPHSHIGLIEMSPTSLISGTFRAPAETFSCGKGFGIHSCILTVSSRPRFTVIYFSYLIQLHYLLWYFVQAKVKEKQRNVHTQYWKVNLSTLSEAV